MNIKEKYFTASFRFDKSKSEDFNLKKVEGEDYFIDKLGNHWIQDYLWDNGWGNEYGFIKLPELNFEELWTLLIDSNIFENYQGASEIINRKHPFELKNKLQALFSTNQKLNRRLTKRIGLLELGVNRNEVIGVKKEEVEKNYLEWKKLKTDFEKLSKKRCWIF